MRLEIYSKNGIQDGQTFKAIRDLLLSDAEFEFNAFQAFNLSNSDLAYMKKELKDNDILMVLLGVVKHAYLGTLKPSAMIDILNCVKNIDHLNDTELCDLLKAHYLKDGKCVSQLHIVCDENVMKFCLRNTEMSKMFKEVLQQYHKTKSIFLRGSDVQTKVNFLKWTEITCLNFWDDDRAMFHWDVVNDINSAGMTVSVRASQFWNAWLATPKKITEYGKNAKRLLKIIGGKSVDVQKELLPMINIDKLDKDARAEYIRLTSKIVL